MTDKRIVPIVMPKWGLSMKEGKLTSWLISPGTEIKPGDSILEIETDKIAGSFEAPDGGLLRRAVGEVDVVYPVKALIGVIADPSVPDSEIDEFVSGYVLPAAEDDGEAEADAPQFVDVDGGKLRYAKKGDGAENVILIHGFGGDLVTWMFNVDGIAENATTYALDLPGHGQSSKKIADPTVAGLARTVVSFMESLGIEKAHFVGHSLGGAIAMEVARSAPGRVKSLSLVAPAGLGPEINIDYLNGFVAANSRRDLKDLLGKLFADQSLVSRQMMDEVLKYKRLDGVVPALRSLADGFAPGGKQKDILSASLKPAIPTLVIWGKEDQIIPVAHAANAKGAKVEILEGAGHMPHMEKASKVTSLIKEQVAGKG